jgi:hypothetical protein
MKYCEHCQVNIREDREECILCGNPLQITDVTEDYDELFPDIPPFYERRLAIRILIFISIVTVASSFAINFIFPTEINWPLLVLFALLSVWVGLFIIVQKRYHIPKKIIWLVVTISLLALFWDWWTGWRGWSLEFVIPIIIVSAMIIMYITARIMRLSINDYITYALIDGIFGIVPLLFILFGWVDLIYPSIISIVASIIFLAAIFIFQGEAIKTEILKRLHV